MPDVIVVAANAKGEIVRYFEAGETASYFGSPAARSSASGHYDAAARGAHDRLDGQDPRRHRHRQCPARPARHALSRPGRAGARRARGLRQGRAARRPEAGARSSPLPARSTSRSSGAPRSWARRRMRRLIDRFGFNLPPARAAEEGDAAVDGGRARADRRLAAPRASDGGRGAGVADRAGPQAGAAADTGEGVRFHQPRGRRGSRRVGVRQHRAEPADQRPRPAAAQDAAAGAAVLRPRRRAARHLEEPERLVPGPAHGSQAALRQDRHVGGYRHQRDGRHVDRRRPAVRQRRGLFVRRADRHGIAEPNRGRDRCMPRRSACRCWRRCWPTSRSTPRSTACRSPRRRGRSPLRRNPRLSPSPRGANGCFQTN